MSLIPDLSSGPKLVTKRQLVKQPTSAFDASDEVEDVPALERGDRVRIVAGDYKGRKGQIIEVTSVHDTGDRFYTVHLDSSEDVVIDPNQCLVFSPSSLVRTSIVTATKLVVKGTLQCSGSGTLFIDVNGSKEYLSSLVGTEIEIFKSVQEEA